MKLSKLMNSLGLRNVVLAIWKRNRLVKNRLFKKVYISKYILPNYQSEKKFSDSKQTIGNNEKDGENEKDEKSEKNDKENNAKREEVRDEQGFIIQLRRDKTKKLNEQTDSNTKGSNVTATKNIQKQILNTKSLLGTDENHYKANDDLTQLKLSQLRAQLRAYGLSTVGKKDVLVQRLQSYLMLKSEKSIAQTPVKDYKLEAGSSDKKAEEKLSAEENLTAKVNDSAEETYKKSDENYTAITEHERGESTAEKTLIPSSPIEIAAKPLSDNLTEVKEQIDGITETESAKDNSDALASSSNANEELVTSSNDGSIVDHSCEQTTLENTIKQAEGDVFVEYIQGLPHLTVPLPSRLEKCRFALRPVSQKVGDLIDMLKIEDHGIDRAVVLNKCGVRIASTCAIDSLLDEPFWLQINDNKYEVIPPKRKKLDSEDIKTLSDVRTLVAQLYEALHVGEYHLHKEQELVKKIENLKFEISPLEMEKQELTKLAERKTVIATWVGLSLMAVQFGVLARLTWWEYSWDIMEPVTYFVTYGTTMAMYAYYCLTKSEYNFEKVRDRLFLISIHKKAKRKNFDVEKYNLLKREIAEAEYDLRRLRDPINLQLPPHVDRSQRITPIDPPSGGSGGSNSGSSGSTDTRLVTAVTCEKKPLSFRLPFLETKN